MQSLTPSGIDLKSRVSGLWRVGPGRPFLQCLSRYDSPNANSDSTASKTAGFNFSTWHFGKARPKWPSACAILDSKVVSQQQDTGKRGGGAHGVSAVDGHPTLDLVPVKVSDSPRPLPKPLSIADLSPVPMHGSQLRVACLGVPGAYSEAAAGEAYPYCEGDPELHRQRRLHC